MKITRLLFLCLVFVAASGFKLQTQEITYKSGKTTLKGYLAWDASKKGKRPGVLVVHEWWGHNKHARNAANKLARAGYIALAVDMYGSGKTADHPKKAKEFMTAAFSNMKTLKARFMAAMKVLKKHKLSKRRKIAAIGYCFGGAVVLHMARHGVALKGVASFHGSLGTKTPARPGAIKAAILVMNGADDKLVSAESIKALKKEMINARVNDFRFINYPGAKHSFTNPAADEFAKKFKMPVGYNKKADELSWEELQKFLKRVFK